MIVIWVSIDFLWATHVEILYHACEALEFYTFTGSSDGCGFVLSARRKRIQCNAVGKTFLLLKILVSSTIKRVTTIIAKTIPPAEPSINTSEFSVV